MGMSKSLSADPSAQEITWADTTLIRRHFITLDCLLLAVRRDGKVRKEMGVVAVAFRDTKVGRGHKVRKEIRGGKDYRVRRT
jgi:hypothetical protein